MKRFFVVVTVCLWLLTLGCGGGSSANPPTPSTPSFASGNWVITVGSTILTGITYVGGNLTQSGTSVSGIMHVHGSSCYDLDLMTDIPVSGSVDSSGAFTLASSSVSGQVITVTGTISGTGNKVFTGNYTILGGCASGDKGIVSGAWVPSITGTWKATEVSGSTTVSVTSAVTQSATADVHGMFPLSGTFTFTATGGSSCSNSATIRGGNSFIVGDFIYVEADTKDFNNTNGVLEWGAYVDNPPTATSFTGIYQYQSGACTGLSNTLKFTKQ